VVNGKHEEVLELLRKICRINKKCLPQDFNPTCLLAEVGYASFATCAVNLTLLW